MLRNSLTRYTARHLRIKYLVQFILAGPVYHNALTNCATRVCCACAGPPACVAEHYLTLRTGCSRGRTPKVVRPQQRKNPLPFPCFAAVTCRQSAPDYPRERGDPQEGGNRRCLSSCAPARRQRRLSTLLCARAASAQFPSLRKRHSRRSAPERKRGTLLPRSVPLCAYYWFLFS